MSSKFGAIANDALNILKKDFDNLGHGVVKDFMKKNGLNSSHTAEDVVKAYKAHREGMSVEVADTMEAFGEKIINKNTDYSQKEFRGAVEKLYDTDNWKKADNWQKESMIKSHIDDSRTAIKKEAQYSYENTAQARVLNENIDVNKNLNIDVDTINSGNKVSLEKIAKKTGFKVESGADLTAQRTELESHVRDFYNTKREGISSTVGIKDRMTYHKVPQSAAALGGTAWLISGMSATKGQMSNAELYGQKSPYGGGMGM